MERLHQGLQRKHNDAVHDTATYPARDLIPRYQKVKRCKFNSQNSIFTQVQETVAELNFSPSLTMPEALF